MRIPRAYNRSGSGIGFLVAWSGTLIGLIVATNYSTLFSSTPSVWGYVLILGISSAVCFGVMVMGVPFSVQIVKQIDLLEIPVYMTLTNLFLIGITGVAVYFDPSLLILPSTADLPASLLLITASLWAMWGGYALVSLTWRKQNPEARAARFSTPSLRRTLILYGGVLLLRLGLFAAGSGERFRIGGGLDLFGEWSQWVTYLRATSWVTLALILIQVMRGKWGRWLYGTLVIELLMAILTGWASQLIKLAALFLAVMVYTRKPPGSRLIVIALWVLGSFMLTPLARFMRGTDQDLDALLRGVQVVANSDAANSTWTLFLRRQSAIAQTPALIMLKTPSVVPYRSLDELMLAPFSFIPRALWTNKPAYADIGSLVTSQYFGIDPRNGSSAATFAGNLYMYGGTALVILVMIAFGAFSAVIYRVFAVPGLLSGQVGLLAAYAGIVIFNLHLGEGEILGTFQGMLQVSVIFYGAAWWLCPRREG